MSDEEENWGDYIEDSEGADSGKSEGKIELENTFYSAEEMKETDPAGAIEQYFFLLDSEEPLTEKAWSAKCIAEIISIKVKRNELKDLAEVVHKLLTYVHNMTRYDRGVTVDIIYAAVNKIPDIEKRRQSLEALLGFLKEKDMTQIWMTISIKLARLYLSSGQTQRFEDVTPSSPDTQSRRSLSRHPRLQHCQEQRQEPQHLRGHPGT